MTLFRTKPTRHFIVGEPTLTRAGRGQYAVVYPLAWWMDITLYMVHAQFRTDGGSIPPIFWPIVGHPYSPSSIRACIIHDWLCRERVLPPGLVHDIFYDLLLHDGVAPLRAWLMWTAVKNFGPTWTTPTPAGDPHG